MPSQLLSLHLLTSSSRLLPSSHRGCLTCRAPPPKLRHSGLSLEPPPGFFPRSGKGFRIRALRVHSVRPRKGEFREGRIGGRERRPIGIDAEASNSAINMKEDSFGVGWSRGSVGLDDDGDMSRIRDGNGDEVKVRVSLPSRQRKRNPSKSHRDWFPNDFASNMDKRQSRSSFVPSHASRASKPSREDGFDTSVSKGSGVAVVKRGRSDPDLNNSRGIDKKRPFPGVDDEAVDDSGYEISGFHRNLNATDDGNNGLFKDLDNSQLAQKSPIGNADYYLSKTRFDQCSISPLSLKGIKAAGYERMTIVQEATLPVILRGKDVLAKAKTGTGKTVAFLLPAIEVIAKLPSVDRDQRRPPIYVLVICPTRELANQAAMEASQLLKFHTSIGVQVVIGGTRLTLEQKRMQANPCQILVATPGRLKDHIENTPGFATRLMGVKVLVLDEADHLLDMGFRKDIEKIVAAVPKQRQTLLFSATVPEEVRQVSNIALRRDHEFINTVEEGNEETHSQVSQMVLLAPLEKHFPMLFALLTEHIAEDVDYKVLVFCTTAMVTKLVANLLSELNLNVREIHSRKPQSYRTRVSEEFRKSKSLILVTSDVSARGVDYPDVTLVIQLGMPSDREQYIHRLGRTGRTGKEGKGILLLAPWEEFFLANVKDLPMTKAVLPPIGHDSGKKVAEALLRVEVKNKESAYQAWLGYYNSNRNIGRDKSRLVSLANEFSRTMGLDQPPAIPKLILGKMGLKNVRGLRAK